MEDPRNRWRGAPTDMRRQRIHMIVMGNLVTHQSFEGHGAATPDVDNDAVLLEYGVCQDRHDALAGSGLSLRTSLDQIASDLTSGRPDVASERADASVREVNSELPWRSAF